MTNTGAVFSPRSPVSKGSRRSGILVPLFSLTSAHSWGVGEFLDLPVFSKWLESARQSFIQILPITEIPEAETSPYSALTAMALDPIYISLRGVEDFQALGGDAHLADQDRATLDEVRRSTRIQHQRVRSLKSRWLRRAYERFNSEELSRYSPRAQRFETFTRDESWWLEDYALFQALRGRHRLRAWWDWPVPLARLQGDALTRAREELRAEIDYRKYLQWIAGQQWAEARERSKPLQVFGDLPFMISADSPDVWTQQNEFRLDATIGVPPDAFSETGQDWGLPPWRSDVMARNDFEWMRRRARRMARLFDGFRLDHVVGFYRTYIRPLDSSVKPFFSPDDEPAQLWQGERLVRIYLESGAEIVAEDLGTVPESARKSLRRLGVPGFKVLRWERHWSTPNQPFVDPPEYPPISVATTGTHDIEPLAVWWDGLSSEARQQILAIPSVARRLAKPGGSSASHISDDFTPQIDEALLRGLLDAGSRLVIIPIQDVFGWRDRINTPASVSDENWSWRLPWPVDRLNQIPEARERAQLLARWTRAADR